MKCNKGVTIISLIITIIVIIILASVTIFYGLNKNTDKAIDTKTVNEVFSILDAVTNRELMRKLNPNYYKYVGTKDFTDETYSSADGWYLISGEKDLKELGLDNVEGSYFVNYEKGLVESKEGIVFQGKKYFSLNDLRKQMGGSSTIFANFEFDAVKGVNRPVLSEGMIPVKYSGASWVVVSPDNDAWYDYSKEQEAWANVMLKDELTLKSGEEIITNEKVRDMSISEMVGMEVNDEGSAYVWIPRYTIGSNSEIVFSNLTEDYTNEGKYKVPKAFTYINSGDWGTEVVELPGIWVSKYEVSYDG